MELRPLGAVSTTLVKSRPPLDVAIQGGQVGDPVDHGVSPSLTVTPTAQAGPDVASPEVKTNLAPAVIVPAPPKSLTILEEPSVAKALGVRELNTIFEGPEKFRMRMRTAVLEVQRATGVEQILVPFVNGPGHNCSMVAGLARDPETGKLSAILRTGDSRASRSLRHIPPVKNGFIGGRHDKMKDSAHIAMEEVAEEVGGSCLEGGFRSLGDRLTPTMPHESTEADQYFVAMMVLDKQVTGDGGGMELPGLIEPLPVPIELGEAFAKIAHGEVADGARCRLVFQRALDSIGYIPQLGVSVHDHPKLKARWDTLGLGEVWDPRNLPPKPPSEPDAPEPPGPPPDPEAARVNDVMFHSVKEHPVLPGVTFLEAQTSHAIHEDGKVRPHGPTFPNYILKLDYDRAKLLAYSDPEHPRVRWVPQELPALAVKGFLDKSESGYHDQKTDLVRDNLPEFKLDLQDTEEQLQRLVASSGYTGKAEKLISDQGASEGQSDLRYHFYALPSERGSDFIPLREALRACRLGEAGDAQTEGALSFLADRLNYIPGLDMTVEEARKLL